MFRKIAFFIYFFAYLIYSLPTLKKVKHLPISMAVQERDRIQHELPKRWARNLVRITGSTITVEGDAHIPNGPVLFVSNHQGNFDVPVLLGFVEKPFGFFSKVEVKKIPFIPRWMEVMNCVFVDRSNRRQALQSIKESVALLKEGHSMVIFPEGTRSKGGPVAEFKTGGLRMAIDANVPIVPIAIEGTYKIMEQNKVGFKRANVTVSILEPITSHLKEEKTDTKELAAHIQKVIAKKLNK
ncbi:lysophospholipid acyltransferase family protein [Metabacillus iocasae]|uniref:1-acyl-sn-glycerol-3-phosphate acyltransferase n=1 Tax=Priestia iocasae TaxID=2291674 RepID=A0ABS2QXJ5_9BACI|nr:lysophospholipid acyltransferase family protein [Metabacillus iocasae]MBM7703204.1 1-acyl-sn-glycerol-3-phosphate acyltransferase [Metabacillus iocasae]